MFVVYFFFVLVSMEIIREIRILLIADTTVNVSQFENVALLESNAYFIVLQQLRADIFYCYDRSLPSRGSFDPNQLWKEFYRISNQSVRKQPSQWQTLDNLHVTGITKNVFISSSLVLSFMIFLLARPLSDFGTKFNWSYRWCHWAQCWHSERPRSYFKLYVRNNKINFLNSLIYMLTIMWFVDFA